MQYHHQEWKIKLILGAGTAHCWAGKEQDAALAPPRDGGGYAVDHGDLRPHAIQGRYQPLAPAPPWRTADNQVRCLTLPNFNRAPPQFIDLFNISLLKEFKGKQCFGSGSGWRFLPGSGSAKKMRIRNPGLPGFTSLTCIANLAITAKLLFWQF